MNFLQVWACLKKDSVKILPLHHTHPQSWWNSLLSEVVVFLHQDVSQDKTDMKPTVLPSFYWSIHHVIFYSIIAYYKKNTSSRHPSCDTCTHTPQLH